MSETNLQLGKQKVSELKQRILKQQTVVLALRREGGMRLERETARWESLKDELAVLESRLDQLVFNA